MYQVHIYIISIATMYLYISLHIQLPICVYFMLEIHKLSFLFKFLYSSSNTKKYEHMMKCQLHKRWKHKNKAPDISIYIYNSLIFPQYESPTLIVTPPFLQSKMLYVYINKSGQRDLQNKALSSIMSKNNTTFSGLQPSCSLF